MVRIFPFETEIEILVVMSGLHLHGDAAPLAGDGRGLGLFASDHLLAHVVDLLVVAGGATVAPLVEGARAAVVSAVKHPFDGGLPRIEQGDLAFGDTAPVDAEARGRFCCGRDRRRGHDGPSPGGGGQRQSRLLFGERLLDGLLDSLFLRLLGGKLRLPRPLLGGLLFGSLLGLFLFDPL